MNNNLAKRSRVLMLVGGILLVIYGVIVTATNLFSLSQLASVGRHSTGAAIALYTSAMKPIAMLMFVLLGLHFILGARYKYLGIIPSAVIAVYNIAVLLLPLAQGGYGLDSENKWIVLISLCSISASVAMIAVAVMLIVSFATQHSLKITIIVASVLRLVLYAIGIALQFCWFIENLGVEVAITASVSTVFNLIMLILCVSGIIVGIIGYSNEKKTIDVGGGNNDFHS